MIRTLLLFVTAIIAVGTNAQKKNSPELYAKTISAADLKAHLSIIAGAEMEGRDTPSPGLEKAADYITAQFKKFGLKPGNNGIFRQTYTLSKDSVSSSGLSIDGIAFKPYADFTPALSIPDNVNLRFSEYTFVGYGIVDENQNDYANTDVKGKLVVILSGEPVGYQPKQKGRLSPATTSNKLKAARKNGAAAVLIITEELPTRYSAKTSYSPVNPKTVESAAIMPAFNISDNIVAQTNGHSIEKIKSAITSRQIELPMVTKAEVVMQYTLQKSTATASNVIGIVEGSDKKDEYLFVTAHYDHVGKDAAGNIYYGADDDGSGTVSVLEMAEAFAKAKKEGKGPRRTVVFMTVSGEEKGLWGSEYYSDNPIFPLAKTTADLNIDMIGRIGTDYLKEADSLNYVYVIGDDKLSSDLTPITEAVNKKYTKLKLDRKFNDPNDPERIYYRSDHYNFARKGVPVIFYFDGIHADYHRITDTVDKINFPLMTKRAQLVFYTAWEMANRNDILKRDRELPQ